MDLTPERPADRGGGREGGRGGVSEIPVGHWFLEDTALLGPAGEPLLPLVERFLDHPYDWARMSDSWRRSGRTSARPAPGRHR